MEFGQFIPYYKRKHFSETFYKNCDLKTSSRQFGEVLQFCFARNLAQPLLETKSLKQATYVRYVLAKLSKFV